MLIDNFSTVVSMEARCISNRIVIYLAMHQEPSRRLSHRCHGADVICIRHDILCDSYLDAALHTVGVRVHDDVLYCKYPAHDVQFDDVHAYAAFCVRNDPYGAYGDHTCYCGFANGVLLQSNGHRHHRPRLPVRRLKRGPIVRKFLILISNFYVSFVPPSKPSVGW